MSSSTRARNLRYRYGITEADFDARLAEQGGVCAVCGTDDPGGRWGTFAVDHDHACCPGQRSCGKCIRGLTCYVCNAVIVPAVEAGLADKAAEYVRAHSPALVS